MSARDTRRYRCVLLVQTYDRAAETLDSRVWRALRTVHEGCSPQPVGSFREGIPHFGTSKLEGIGRL